MRYGRLAGEHAHGLHDELVAFSPSDPRSPVEAVVEDFKRRTEGRPMGLVTSDEHRPSKGAVLRAYGVEATTTPSGLPVRAPHKEPPPDLCYATVHKTHRLGRVVGIVVRLVFAPRRCWRPRCRHRR
jgi:hypothetical protein